MEIDKSSTNFSNLEKILNITKDKIILIVLITAFTIFFTNYIIFKINNNASFKAKTMLDVSRGISFNSVTNLENIFNSFLSADNNLPDNKLQIQNINYFDLYLETLNETLFVKLFDEYNFLKKEVYANEADYFNDLKSLYENNLDVKVEKRLIFEDKITNSLWSLTFTGPLEKKKIWIKILKRLKEESFKEFKTRVIESIREKLLLVNTVIDNDIELINNKIDFALKESFKYKNNELLIYLNEQAGIARELGIDNGLQIIKSGEVNDFFNLIDPRGSEFLSFQWGYIAIEKKIDDIMSRDQADAKYFVNEYEDLLKKKNELSQSKEYFNTLYKDILVKLPLNNYKGDFFAASTEFSTNKINTITVILLNIIFIIIANIILAAIIALNNKKKLSKN